MQQEAVIEALNRAIRLENTAMLQAQQQGLLVRGVLRPVYKEFFFGQSDEAREHARKFGQKVVALGGVPTIEVTTVRQSLVLEEMLRHCLALEREALDAYKAAHELTDDDIALNNMLEDHIEDESRHIEELELMLQDVATSAVVPEVTLRRVS